MKDSHVVAVAHITALSVIACDVSQIQKHRRGRVGLRCGDAVCGDILHVRLQKEVIPAFGTPPCAQEYV